jgi:hypothetical protein
VVLELVEHCRNLNARLYGLTQKRVMQLAFHFSEMNGLSHRFNTEKRLAGKDWAVAFYKRQGLTLRTPEQCSIRQCDRIQQSTSDVDETGISSTVPASVLKVVTTKGGKTVCKVTLGEKGETMTAVCCMSVTALYVPPALIFPRKRMAPYLFTNTPTGTL